jgi:hypothetical protein
MYEKILKALKDKYSTTTEAISFDFDLNKGMISTKGKIVLYANLSYYDSRKKLTVALIEGEDFVL